MLFGRKKKEQIGEKAEKFPKERISEDAVKRFMTWYGTAKRSQRTACCEPYFVHLLSQTLPYQTPGKTSFSPDDIAFTLDMGKKPARWTEDADLVGSFIAIGVKHDLVAKMEHENGQTTIGRCWQIAPIWYGESGPVQIALPPEGERMTSPEVLARLNKINYASRWVSGEDLGFITKNWDDWRKNATAEQYEQISKDFLPWQR